MLVSPTVPTPAAVQAASRAHGPFARGEHGFEMVNAEGRASKRSGRAMVTLQLVVRSEDGHRRAVFDHLPRSERARWRAEAVAAAVGLLEPHESGAPGPSDLGAKTGRPPLDVRLASEECGARNVVKRYLVPDAGGAASRGAPVPVHMGGFSSIRFPDQMRDELVPL